MLRTRIVVVDVGGTHVRFALAEVEQGKVISLDEPITLHTRDHPTFRAAWDHFAKQVDRELPRNCAIAIAGPVGADVIRLTNSPWTICPALLPDELEVDRYTVVNDLVAVGHAVACAPESNLMHIAGPDTPLPKAGTISVVGPGTGLGVSHVWRDGAGSYRVQATEGGHIGFAPLDSIDDAILIRLRQRHARVSIERVVAGPAIVGIYETLAAIEGRAIQSIDDRTIWTSGISGADSLAVAAVDRFCLSLGSTAGDIALAHGASAVVIAGGLGLRIRENLLSSGFASRFRAKGRFEDLMAKVPVKLITHAQPGLFGAAAAFAREHLA